MFEYFPLSNKCICSKNEHHWIYWKRFIIIVLIEIEIIYFIWSSDEVQKMMAFFRAGLCTISGWWSCNGIDGCGMQIFIQWYIYISLSLILIYIYIYTPYIYTHICILYIYIILVYIFIYHNTSSIYILYIYHSAPPNSTGCTRLGGLLKSTTVIHWQRERVS